MRNNIIVNATAARSSGALTILKQFINNIPPNLSSDYYYIFIDSLSLFKGEVFPNNILLIEKQTRSWSSRILWDAFGLRRWIQNSKLDISLCISLQNTGSRISNNIQQIVYYHQLLPIFNKRWNFFKKKERLFFFYKYFYSFFVKIYDRHDTNIVVQVPFIKDLYINKFNINPDRVNVIKPSIKDIEWESIPKIPLTKDIIHFIYPATSLVYKNHILLVKTVKHLRDKYLFNLDKICVHFTFNAIECQDISNFIEKNKLEKNFIFHDTMQFDVLLSYYKTTHCLLFPSYIETLGLPLLEAASIGMPILVNDLPYSRDVVGDYKGCKFLEFNNIDAWAKAFIEIVDSPARFEPYIPKERDGWNSFFNLVTKLKKYK